VVVQVFLPVGHALGPTLDHDIEFITNHAEVALTGEIGFNLAARRSVFEVSSWTLVLVPDRLFSLLKSLLF